MTIVIAPVAQLDIEHAVPPVGEEVRPIKVCGASNAEADWYPTTQTCFSTILFPEYSSVTIFKQVGGGNTK